MQSRLMVTLTYSCVLPLLGPAEHSFELCCLLGPSASSFIHSMLLQFTQRYESVPGYRLWWIFMQSLFINYSMA